MHWVIPCLVAAGCLIPALGRWWNGRVPLIASAVPAAIAAVSIWQQSLLAAGEVVQFHAPWVPSAGIAWAFRLDPLGNLFVGLIAGIGTAVVAYSAAAYSGDARLPRLHGALFVFMAAMLGIATADDLVVLFLCWELTTVSSFLLVGFDHQTEAARVAARRALLVTATGGLALLTGFVAIAVVAGTTSISTIVASGDLLRAHAAYPWILGCILAGAFAKSAQFPLHFWLPGAMKAPTPISAYLHSATMVKAGVFLLARFSPVLGGTDAWFAIFVGIGATTMVLGATAAVAQDDLKRLLAYSTLSVLGLLTLLLGLGTPIAARAFVVTWMAHALYKATLFLIAGNIDHATGTRSLTALRGLRGALPATAAAGIIAAVSMGGAPPLFGFLAKETAYEAVFEAPRWAGLLGSLTVASAVCLVFAALRSGVQPFWDSGRGATPVLRALPIPMQAAPVALGTLGLVAGMLVGPAERFWIAPAALAINQSAAPTGLSLWHGFTPILAASAATLALGALVFTNRARVVPWVGRFAPWVATGPSAIWDAGWRVLLQGARWQTSQLQNGSPRRYVATTLAAALAVIAVGLPWGTIVGAVHEIAPFEIVALAAGLLVMGGSLITLRAPTPLAAVAALGAVGVGVSLVFLVYSAPDLALTQLVVEVLTVVLFALVVRLLPRAKTQTMGSHRPSAIVLATIGGVLMAGLSLLASQPGLLEPTSAYFELNSVALAHGRNIVNVILVDFRSLDTLGEIVVLTVAALGAVSLLARRRATSTGGIAP